MNTQCFEDKGGQSVSACIMCLLIIANVSLCGPRPPLQGQNSVNTDKNVPYLLGSGEKTHQYYLLSQYIYFCLVITLERMLSSSSPNFIAIFRPSHYVKQDLVLPSEREYYQMGNEIQASYRRERYSVRIKPVSFNIPRDKNVPNNVLGEARSIDTQGK